MGKLLMRGLPFSGKEPDRNTRHRKPLQRAVRGGAFLYNENHALDAWFKKAYGDE